jgi:hypothetical protein
MKNVSLATLLLLLSLPGGASGQFMSARRMGMGGVVLAGGGQGSSSINVAYRAVPPAPEQGSGLPLPIGLIPVIADPPVLDYKDPGFNAYELANLLYNPPWNLTLGGSDAPSNDITIAVGKNSLAVDLGDVADIFPKERSRIGAVSGAPSIAVGIGRLFVGVAPLVHFDNDLHLNDALHGALADGEAFVPSTEYALYDQGRAQVAIGAHLGWAGAVARRGDPRAGGTALYAGARLKLLRGLAYGDADNTVAFTTMDTLFGTDPVDIHYVGHLRDAGPAGGRLGRGLDLGMVWLSRALEVGVGVNNIATRIGWRVREHLASSDSVSGDYVDRILREDAPFTSEVPVTVTANAATRLGPALVAVDIVRGLHQTLGHLGAELWTGSIAWRAGLSTDANQQAQGSAGVGLRFGGIGLDLALASNSRNISRTRELELGAGLEFYHGAKR